MKKENVEASVNTEKNKKKRPAIIHFFRFLLTLILIIVIALTAWFSYCLINKTTSLKAIPTEYSLYLRTDSLWEAVNPLLDLKAADLLLADEPFVQFRQTFLDLRESKLRDNFFVSYALSRRIDAALYEDNSFIVIADMGLLSGLTRLAPLITRFYSIENLKYTLAGKDSCFEYQTEDMTVYAKPYKNLVIATNSKAILHSALSQNNELSYTKAELKLLEQALEQPFRVAADGRKLIALLEEENPYLKTITDCLSTKELTEIKFGLTDDNIDVSIKLPFEISKELEDNPVAKLLDKNSQIPQLITNLPESVQYYTFVTAGNLSELKDAAFTVLTDKPELAKKWADADGISKMVFKESLEEIIFSWTDDEYAVLGIEGKSEPVFAIKIKDEAKRQYIFETILSSIIFKTDNSLLLDGIRLPKIEFPQFIQSLLESFGINLPKPYYMVKDNFVYFSQSPENLACINAAIKGGAKLSKNENWKQVSEKQNAQSSLSLFYNLERSIPFFIKKQSLVSDILQLYNIGRLDVMIKDTTIYLTLQACTQQTKSTKYIPGFPLTLEGKASPLLYKLSDDKYKTIFWQEGANTVKTLNTGTLKINSKEINNLAYVTSNSIISKQKATLSENANQIWALTKDGNVYLFNEKLETKEQFPVITGEKPSCQPQVFNNNLIFFTESGSFISVDSKGKVSTMDFDLMNEIKSAPTVNENTIAVYEKGFMGIIHLIRQNYSESLLDVEGIAFGSPCLAQINGKNYTAFITQAGQLNVWDESNTPLADFPLELPGIFYLNVKATSNYFFALASDGTLYRISTDGQVTAVQIPYLSAKSGYITIYDYDGDGRDEIFICGDSNTIYGFSEDLEYLNGFPLSGYGVPVFIDVNGDKIPDCLSLTIDNKLNAWKVN